MRAPAHPSPPTLAPFWLSVPPLSGLSPAAHRAVSLWPLSRLSPRLPPRSTRGVAIGPRPPMVAPGFTRIPRSLLPSSPRAGEHPIACNSPATNAPGSRRTARRACPRSATTTARAACTSTPSRRDPSGRPARRGGSAQRGAASAPTADHARCAVTRTAGPSEARARAGGGARARSLWFAPSHPPFQPSPTSPLQISSTATSEPRCSRASGSGGEAPRGDASERNHKTDRGQTRARGARGTTSPRTALSTQGFWRGLPAAPPARATNAPTRGPPALRMLWFCRSRRAQGHGCATLLRFGLARRPTGGNPPG